MEAIDFQTDPSRYKHWRLPFDGPVATLTMDVAEDGGIRPGYKLKLNSYDLGVDIELADALNRIRFEHPEVRSVIMTSAILDVHQGDVKRQRGRVAPLGSEIHRRRERHLRGRRLRDGARLRPDR